MIEFGGSGRQPLWPWRGVRAVTTGIALAALAAGLLVGFDVGRMTAAPKVTHSRPPASAASLPLSATPAIVFDGDRCALQRGKALQLGIEVVNQTSSTIIVDRITSRLPVRGGLVQTGSSLAACGELMPPGGPPSDTIASGASAWLSLTFAVPVRCPAPYPVQFVLKYTVAGKSLSAYLDGFPDLGQVPYTGCPGGS